MSTFRKNKKKSKGKHAHSAAAKKALQRRIRVMIGVAHRRMAASEVRQAVQMFEQAEKACLELLGEGEELLGEIHHCMAYCFETLGDRTMCKVRVPFDNCAAPTVEINTVAY